MAAFSGPAIGRASFNGGSRLEHLLLPNGACSFRDLNAGIQAPTCGCRRFWLNTTSVIAQEGERAWCFCGHHACFHDSVQPVQSQGVEVAGNGPNVFPSSHQVNTSGQKGGFVAPTWSELIEEHRSSSSRAGNVEAAPARSTTGLGIRNSPAQSHSPSINTKLWHALNGFARQQEDGRHSGDTSKLPSTAVPSVYEEQRASPAREMQPQAQAQRARSMGPPINIPPTNFNAQGMDDYSATEVATPSVQGTPDFRALTVPGGIPGPSPRHRTSPLHRPSSELRAATTHETQAQPHGDRVSNTSQPRAPTAGSVGPSLSIQEMCNTIQDYGRRINLLETVSFAHMPPEEVQDKFDFLDGRVLDLEHYRRDQEKAQENDDTERKLSQFDNRVSDLEMWRTDHENVQSSQESGHPPQSSGSRKRRLPDDEDAASVASDGSFDENAAAQTEAIVLATLAANAETGPRIDALEHRIANIENTALPSYARPWHVQVVILPFGRDLPGVWFSASESTRHSMRSATQASEEWSQPQDATKSSFRSIESGWTTQSIEAWNRQCANEAQVEWLSPKACGPSGAVFQRLASRGLVRDVVLHASDARHVCGAISQAFGDVIPSGNSTLSASMTAKYHGLREPFVPLRKVRKSTRLRFLSPAEMVTPATWSAEFLESSVFMKVNDGERRLYLTTPSGYLQSNQPGWSWPSLRDLPTYDADGEVQAAEDEGHLIESCWTYNERLDQASSLHSSFASHDSTWEISSEAAVGQDDGDKEDLPMLSPSATRHSHIRSTSLPSSVNFTDAESIPKRRVASFEYESTTSIAVPGDMEYSSPEYISKRRRISTSPELERRGVNFTPRWSREPPSPFTAEEIGAYARSSQARARGTTPFAYATPHSNLDSRGGGDGDTVVHSDDDNNDEDNDRYNDEMDAEEWQGVQDEEVEDGTEQSKAIVIEDLIDEDNLDERGLSTALYGT